MPRSSGRLAAVVLVALVALTVVAAIAQDDERGAGGGREATDAPERFLAAWRTSREGTFRTVTNVTRTSNSTGATLRDVVVVAQRPPDRLSIDRDGATGLVEGRRLYCTWRDEELDCRDARARRTYEEDVERQLDTLGSYVRGPDPLYAVTLGEDELRPEADCFVLTLTRDLVAPPLGTRSRYCFDPATGAPTSNRIERVEADDDAVTVRIEPEVTDADLDPATADHAG